MNHDEASCFFDDLGEATDSRPPTADLVASGRAAERLRRRRSVVAAVVAVVLVCGGSFAVQQVINGSKVKAMNSGGDGLPAPPAGTRYVGARNVVIAIPASWGTDEECEQPVDRGLGNNGLLLTSPCGPGVRSSVSFYVGPSSTDPSETRDVINGVDIRQSDSTCAPRTVCTLPNGHFVRIPSAGVFISWRGGILDDAQALAEQVNSIRLLPDDRTTVPFLPSDVLSGEAGNELISAGLKVVESPTPDLATGRADQYGTDPAAGSVVDVGSTVTLLLAQRTVSDDLVATAQRIVNRYVAEHPREDITSATVMTESGHVREPNTNTGNTCDSGRLLRIDLFGTFPDIGVSAALPRVGPPPGGDGIPGDVTKVALTADAESENVCLIAVHTGTPLKDPDATVVLGPSPATTQATGLADVTVQVPAAWVDDPDECTQAFEDAVTLHEPGPIGDRACGQVPSVYVMSALTGIGHSLAAGSPLVPDSVHRIDVRLGSACSPSAACIYPDGTILEVPAAGVLVLITSSPPDSADARAIIDSLHLESSGPSRLNGTWEALMSGITGGGAAVDKHRDTTFTLTLADGQLDGDDGCNDFDASYQTVERDFVFGPVESTHVGCASTADFVSVLADVRHVTGQGNEFHLHADNWGILVTIRRINDE